MRTYKIHFIRHGLTSANIDGRYIGTTDLPLSPEGIKGLKEIKTELNTLKADVVFTSPLTRCTETCDILFPNKTPIIIDEFKEYDFGDFENKTATELENDPRYLDWTSGKVSTTPGGEDTLEFTTRLVTGLNKTVRKMMELGVYEAAAVMHGGAIMALFSATALPRKQMVEWTCPAGTGFTARITPSLYAKSGIIEIIDTVPSSIIDNDLDDANFDPED